MPRRSADCASGSRPKEAPRARSVRRMPTEPSREPLRVHARRLPRPTLGDEAARGGAILAAFTARLMPQLVGIARRGERGEAALLTAAHGVRAAFQDLGGTFVKFGQLVASSPGLFGVDLAEEFRACLDTGPPVPFDLVQACVEDELGMAL